MTPTLSFVTPPEGSPPPPESSPHPASASASASTSAHAGLIIDLIRTSLPSSTVAKNMSNHSQGRRLRGCPPEREAKGAQSMFSTRVAIALAIAGLVVESRRPAATTATEAGGGGGGGETLTIYSSLPLQGAARAQAEATVNGAKLALERAGGKAGDFTSTSSRSTTRPPRPRGGSPARRRPTPARRPPTTHDRLHRRVQLRRHGRLAADPQRGRHPADQPGQHRRRHHLRRPRRRAGEPDKYYPTGERTYARVLPKDTYQGAALAALAKEEGCDSAYILNDQEVYGAGRQDVQLVGEEGRSGDQGQPGDRQDRRELPLARPEDRRHRRRVLHLHRDHANNAVQIFKDMAVALPDAPLLGPEGVGETGFFDPKDGGLPPDVAKRVRITIPGVAPEEYPPAGKQFLEDYDAEYGEKNPDRYAVYGYESMSLLLDAIKRAGDDGGDREAVIEQIFATKDREGVFGTYCIDENGDITLTPYGVYRIKNGALAFDHSIEGEG